MKRERLRRTIALASTDKLKPWEITSAKIKKHVLPILTLYNIRLTTEITDKDIAMAIDIVQRAQPQKPTEFWCDRRRLAFRQRKRFLLEEFDLSY